MAKQFLRVYKEFDVNVIKPHLLVYGDLSGQCENCSEINLKLEMNLCPKCKTEFKYVAFRNVRVHWPKLEKLFAQRPSLAIIDYDDYKRVLGTNKATDFFK